MQTLEREKIMLQKMQIMDRKVRQDPMTGLSNRTEMETRVRDYFSQGRLVPATFFMLDIDNFKNINDLYGHDRGDEAIQETASRLRALFRDEDTVSRMGGDEFAVFMKTALDETQLKERLNTMCRTLCFEIGDASVTCSIGACTSPKDGTGYSEIYHNADSALYLAKNAGKNRWQIYSADKQK